MSESALLDPATPSVATGDDGRTDAAKFYEIVDGKRLEIPPLSAYAGKIASRLAGKLIRFAGDNELGEVVVETLFRLPLAEDQERNRRPDVAFVSYERWPADRPQSQDANAWDVVPDLAVEVISPHDAADELIDRVIEYFRAGVRLVWVVWPRHRLVYVYQSPAQLRAIGDTEVLDAGPLLPGFQLALADLFDPFPAPKAS